MAEATPARPAWLEVDLQAVASNVAALVRRAGGAELCAVVKADGYGHGAVPVARTCLRAGASWLAVALVTEGEQLREAGIEAPILLLAEPPPGAAGRLLAAGLTPTAYSRAMVEALDALGRERSRPVGVHVKVDTGMGRVGVPVGRWPAFVRDVAARDGVAVEGLWTHLACADAADQTATDQQLEAFGEAVDAAREAGLRPRWRHVANTAATLARPDTHHDLVRVGIGIYGLSPAPAMRAADEGLEQALRVRTEVAFAKRLAAGTPVSYGHRWRAPEDGWLATLPVGYADGVPRGLTGRAEVLLEASRRPVAGAVCMDQLLVWCGQTRPAPGQEAVLLGTQGRESILVDEWAAALDTISYEVATGLGLRLPRRYVR